MRTTTPYGAWRSPVTVDLLTAGSVGLSSPVLDEGSLYWLESRASAGGRTSVWRRTPDGEVREMTPGSYVRSTVHEYGGGAYAVSGGRLVWSEFPSGAVRTSRHDEESIMVAAGVGRRYACFRIVADLGLVLAVREDHTVDGEPVATVVALALDGSTETVLVEGADFYDALAVGPDGRLAWCEWDHPNMPWDTARVLAGRLVVEGPGPRVVDVETVCAEPDVAAGRPAWFPDGRLAYMSDASGFWNLWSWDGTTANPLHDSPFDHADPAWTLGGGGYAVLDDERVLVRWIDGGVDRLGILAGGRTTPVPTDACTVHGLTCDGDRIAAVLGYADAPPALVTWALDGTDVEVVRRSAEPLDPAYVSRAEAITFGNPESYAWFYPPTSADHVAPEGELPPLRVLSHGGPTAFSPPAFRLQVQYWTSRGYAVVDVNYSGSAGYGRAYRERLKGRWGIADVRDCVAAAQHLVDRGLVDPARIMIEGGSAGGYTTLRALTSTDFFAAGVSYYGVGDLEALARDTHKFESRYLDPLVAGPDGRPEYAERSPIRHLDRLATPMLILQGTEDRVVPPNQAEEMAAAVRAKGLPVALIMFEGEAHGFRDAASVRRSLEATQAFLGRLFGFEPTDEIDALEIENLS
ncbi:S9 family peptidase [Mariniluteicoccus endophyticus]